MNTESTSSEDFFLHSGGPYMFQPNDDMVIDLFYPFEDDPTRHFQDEFWPSLVSCDPYLFHEDFLPSYLEFDRHQVMAIPRYFEVHTTKRKYFHVDTFGGDLQIKK
jgi:hypothetical protein